MPSKNDATHRLMKLFEGFASAHGTHGVPEKEPDGLKWNIKRTAQTLRQPVTDALWRQHVAGKRPLGVIPIREDNLCSWGSIDFDVYDVDLLDVVRRVEAAKMPLVPCVSKSGGLHLFLFLKDPEPASDVQTVLRDAAASLGMAECEIFPKQRQVLVKHNDLGSWMVMPYYGDTFGGKLRLQRGLKKTGAEMTLAEFVQAGESARTTIMEFAKLCEGRRAAVGASGGGGKKSDGKPSKGDYSDGPPCLQHLTAVPLSEGRKRTLFMMALYYKRIDGTGWKTRLEAANQQFLKPPLPSEEIQSVIKSVSKKDYQYTCKEEPMKSHCDAALCRMRKFGVGKGGEFPRISSISMLESEPPIWFVDIEGARLELSTEELQNFTYFHKACLMRVQKSFKNIRQDLWFTILDDALQNVTKIPAPPDLERSAKFKELLVSFLTNRARGQVRTDLRRNKVFEDEGRYWFTLEALEHFLSERKSLTKLTRPDLGQRLREMSSIHKKMIGLNVWGVLTNKIDEPPPIEPQKIKAQEIDT